MHWTICSYVFKNTHIYVHKYLKICNNNKKKRERETLHLKDNKVEDTLEALEGGEGKYVKVVAINMYFSGKIKCIQQKL